MPGRHAQQPEPSVRRRAVLIAAGLGLALVVAGVVTWATTGPTPATTVANRAGTPAPVTPAAPAGSGTADPNTPPTVLVECARSIESGTAVVEAAAAAREHWGGHVQAQLDYDAGKISSQQMLDIFAATRAAGPADLAAYDAARAAFDPLSGACTGMDPAGVAERWRQDAARCGQRADELGLAVQAGAAVVADWRAHVEMMQNKPHTDSAAYGQLWRDMVAAAPANLNAFTAARDALNRQPPCPMTAH